MFLLIGVCMEIIKNAIMPEDKLAMDLRSLGVGEVMCVNCESDSEFKRVQNKVNRVKSRYKLDIVTRTFKELKGKLYITRES